MQSPAFFAFVFLSAATVWTLGILGRRLKAFLAPPLVALGVGVAYRLVFGAVLPREQVLSLMETLAWVAVGFGVVSIALRLRGHDVRRLLPAGSLIVLVAMLGMWAVTTLVAVLVFGLPPLTAALVGAILTPTDPVVASSIVTGPFAEQHIPARLRQMLSFESGGNDGLAFSFVFLPILLVREGNEAWHGWLLHVDLWQIAGGGAIALAIGCGAGRLLEAARSADLIGHRSIMLASLTLTASVLGLVKLIDANSIWAAFLAGLGLAAVLGEEVRDASNEFQEGANDLAMVPALMLFVLAVPWEEWQDMWVPGLVAVAAVLLFRRLPAVALLYAMLKVRGGAPAPSPEQQEREGIDGRPFRAARDLWFYGWFGPIGLSAILYAATAHRELGDPRIWTVTSFLIAGSMVVHGLTASPFTRLYARAARRG